MRQLIRARSADPAGHDVLLVRRAGIDGRGGLRGIFVDTPDRLGAAWDEALASDRPVVLEVRTDPDVLPLPPHITLTQAKAVASTLWKGDRRRAA